jgi:chemotaxis response regulator CheB
VAVIEGVWELEAADDALAVEVAEAVAKVKSAAQRATDKASNAAVKREAKATKAVVTGSSKGGAARGK